MVSFIEMRRALTECVMGDRCPGELSPGWSTPIAKGSKRGDDRREVDPKNEINGSRHHVVQVFLPRGKKFLLWHTQILEKS